MALIKEKESWHVGKEIPIAMIFTIALQTAGLIWWAATITSKVDSLSYQVASLTEDKYTQHDAIRDQALASERLNNMKQSVDQLKEEMKWLSKK